MSIYGVLSLIHYGTAYLLLLLAIVSMLLAVLITVKSVEDRANELSIDGRMTNKLKLVCGPQWRQ